ncbi:hypothetical protein CHELA40_10150 [Chelatococcus asaccharovorans]|nr:hypothetical protein CHELA40_10150 [Chelatococcus asaccharovorans]CAH1687263.1 hypothetical protein CHELA17_65459 [Chelatococcus asaccharovorans]
MRKGSKQIGTNPNGAASVDRQAAPGEAEEHVSGRATGTAHPGRAQAYFQSRAPVLHFSLEGFGTG